MYFIRFYTSTNCVFSPGSEKNCNFKTVAGAPKLWSIYWYLQNISGRDCFLNYRPLLDSSNFKVFARPQYLTYFPNIDLEYFFKLKNIIFGNIQKQVFLKRSNLYGKYLLLYYLYIMQNYVPWSYSIRISSLLKLSLMSL